MISKFANQSTLQQFKYLTRCVRKIRVNWRTCYMYYCYSKLLTDALTFFRICLETLLAGHTYVRFFTVTFRCFYIHGEARDTSWIFNLIRIESRIKENPYWLLYNVICVLYTEIGSLQLFADSHSCFPISASIAPIDV